MKKEDTIKLVKDKRILAGIAALLLLIVVILCIAAVKKNAGSKTGGMALTMAESLKNSGFSYLPGETRELEKAAEAAAEFLDELVSTGADRQEMVDRLQEYLLSLDWGLTDEQAAELAEWLVDVYLQNYEAVYGKPSGVSQAAAELSDTFLEEMRADLQNISEYLTRLDASVSGNREELISLTEVQNGNYEELAKYLESFQSVVSSMREEITQYRSSQSEQQLLAAEGFQDMETRLDGLSQVILELESRLKESIRNTDGSSSGRYEALEEELDGLSSNLRSEMEALSQRLADMLSELRADGNGINTGLTDLISRSRNELASLLNGLENANRLRYEQMESENDSRTVQISQNVNEKVTFLSGKLDEVHTSIVETQSKVEQMLADMDHSDRLQLEEIMKSFTDINTSLAAINTEMDTAHGELRTLIETVRTEAGENQEELLAVLDQIDLSFAEQSSQNYDALIQSLNSQTESMKEQLEAMNSSLTWNTAQIAIEVSGGNAEILEKLIQMESSTNAMLSGLSGDVQSVFQRVSNGKKLLASALLTKNVVVGEDATFQKIYDGILSINQEIVIGVDRIPGIVEYEYHYHSGSPEDGGGCYTVEEVHKHTADCYQLCTYSWTGCAGDGWTDGNSISHCPYQETHSICYGGQTVYKEYDHPNYGGSQSGHRTSGSSTHAVLVCSKTEGEHCGWKTGCGLQNGQIIGAHITYDANAVSEAASAYEETDTQELISFQKLEALLKAYPAGSTEDAAQKESSGQEEEKEQEEKTPDTEKDVPSEEESGEAETSAEDTDARDPGSDPGGEEPEETSESTEGEESEMQQDPQTGQEDVGDKQSEIMKKPDES